MSCVMRFADNVEITTFVSLKKWTMIRRKNDKSGFEDNYSSYFRRCVLFARSYVFDQNVAESIAAEALSLYWERRSAGEEIQMVLPFLFSVIRNKALRHLRHESLKSKVHDDMSRDIRDELKFRIEALESCDPHTLFAGDVQKILHDTLDSLGGKTGRVFSLSRFNGMTNKEIAEKMGITEKTVEYHISKALKALRVSLKDYLPLIAVFLGL